MPIKTSSGKWKWGNVERDSKKELVQTVYGIWKKNGSKGSFSDFLKGTHESVVLEDKTAMIKKLVLPDIEGQKEKEDYKQELIAFFKSHSNFENKVDWNKFKTLTKKDFDEVIASADKTKGAEKRREKAEIASDIKSIFKSQKGREFFIAGENDRWLFVAPLNYEAAKFCDSSENQGAGAKWCIGYEKTAIHWNGYITNGSVFVMAFNKNYKNLSEKDIEKKLKFMIQRDKDGNYHVWNQPDKDTGDDLSVFGKEKQVADEMFDNVDKKLKEAIAKSIDDANRQVNEYLESNKDKIKEIDPKTNFKIIKKFKNIVTEIKIPEGVTSIGDFTFTNCSKLTSITIPDSVTSIGDSAFFGCSGLTSITIPDGVTSIGESAFYDCSNLTSVTIPAGVTNIGEWAFTNCSKLTSLTIPGSVKRIGNYAFSDCSELTTLIIEDGVESIGDSIVYGCKKLKSIAIPDSVVKFGWAPFYKTTAKFKTIYCSEKIWNKFRDTFESIGHKVERKDPKEMKKESLNEAHEIHSYPEKLQPMLERIVKDNEDYELDHAYFNKEGKFIWMRNSKGYFHVFKPVKFVKTPGMTKPFGFKDLILKDNGMLEEVDRLRFVDGNEGLAYLNKKYHLDLKTIK